MREIAEDVAAWARVVGVVGERQSAGASILGVPRRVRRRPDALPLFRGGGSEAIITPAPCPSPVAVRRAPIVTRVGVGARTRITKAR